MRAPSLLRLAAVARRANAAAEETWQKAMAYQLGCELKDENRRYSAEKVKKLDEVRITSYVYFYTTNSKRCVL